MTNSFPERILISGGREIGGIGSFADSLREGFTALGIAAEILPPFGIFRRVRELRDPKILKILSTTAVFAAPFARRTICMAHGFPCVAHQGWLRTLAVIASFKLATVFHGTQLVCVSDYSALHLQSIFGLRVDSVIRNPVHPMFLEEAPEADRERNAMIYVGRLHSAKNIDRLLPAMRDLLDENSGLQICIVGEGPLRPALESLAGGDNRIEFLGGLPLRQVLGRLRCSRVFVSGNPTEPFGIVYLEALSQGCAVAMPASGGGLEIAPELIGRQIFLFPTAMEREDIASALRKALKAEPVIATLSNYSASSVCQSYLAVDARFTKRGFFQPEGIR
jgi:glycosyltransferase involved in cell wall biosynthesis